MQERLLVLLSLCLVAIATLVLQIEHPLIDGHTRRAGVQKHSSIPNVPNARIAEAYGKLPLSFEVNRGQVDSDVKFFARGSGYSLFLTANEAVLSLSKAANNQSRDREGAVARMRLAGANPSPKVTGADELPGKSNYFIGNDPAKWRTNVPTYAKVRYEDVYPGIDLVYYGNQRQLEYDFVVAPGADPRAIRLAIQSLGSHGTPALSEADGSFVPWAGSGSESLPRAQSRGERAVPLRIDGQGDLVLEVEGSELRLHQPVIYQEIGGIRRRIGGKFVIRGKRQVGFQVAQYDATKTLIIDPVLSYSTYLGGSNSDSAADITVDTSGNVYVTGNTVSTDFPIASPLQTTCNNCVPFSSDAFVMRLNAAGSAVVYSTYLGGSNSDIGRGIAVDSSGNAYVTGHTRSINFPTASPFQGTSRPGSEVFVAKLSPAGNALVYSSYLGGSGDDFGYGIAVDSVGSAYVTGSTSSIEFPTANPFQGAFAGLSDVFVSKLNPAGNGLVYSTYLGGGGLDVGWDIAVDSFGSAYLAGGTSSINFPTANAFQGTFGGDFSQFAGDAFVTKLNAAGSELVYSTYLGGSGSENASGITVDSSGNAYVTGTTNSGDFPTANALQATYHGNADVFVTKFPTLTEGARPSPQLTPGAVVNAASFAAGAPVAAGSIAAVFGSNLASAASGGVSVRLGSTPAFLFYVSPTQINFQVPWEVSGQTQASLTVTVDGVISSPVTVNLAAFSPGIFRIGPSGQGAILIATTAIVAAPVGTVSGARPVIRGAESISIYCTGLGAVTNQPLSGAAAGSNPLSSTTATPSVTIGGVSTTVDFSGLTPGLVGLYQINVLVPPNAPLGAAVPVVVSMGATSHTATIAVQ